MTRGHVLGLVMMIFIGILISIESLAELVHLLQM